MDDNSTLQDASQADVYDSPVTEATVSYPESSSTEDTGTTSTTSVLTEQERTNPINLTTEVAGHDYTELIASIGTQVDVAVEQLQLQTEYEGYIAGFLLFFTVAVLCAYVYKFFRLFF